MDIRSILNTDRELYKINREERFFSATLYSLLVQKNANLKTFVSYLNSKLGKADDKVDESDTDKLDVYFEYAYLRDLWNSFDEEQRRALIYHWLGESKMTLAKFEVPELNKILVGLGKPSMKHIQSPSTWSISKYASHFPRTPQDNKEFERLCKFKWCFKIKPDLVIQVSPTRVFSIEAKLEYGESTYPSISSEKKEWNERKLLPVKQIELQSLMFKDLLNIHASIFCLAKKQSGYRSDGIQTITWKDVFAKMDFSNTHPSAIRALKSTDMI
jgi:hypothetical protein